MPLLLLRVHLRPPVPPCRARDSILNPFPLPPPRIVPLPLRTPDFPLHPLVLLGPFRKFQLAAVQPRRLPALRVHPVRDHMHVRLPVPVRHDQRLVPLHPQRPEALLRCPPHLLPLRLLILGPTQRIVAHRLLQLAPRRRHPRQAFQLRGRLRRGCHDPARPLSLARRQVAGRGPLHPLRALGMVGLPRHPRIVQAVIRHATERAPRGRHLDHHHSLSPASNLATSSPTRSTAAWVSAGDDTALELSARAI